MRYGPEKLSDAELLAVIISSGRKNESALEMAKRILRQIDHPTLINCSIEKLRVHNMGEIKACQLIACFEFCKRFINHKQSVFVMKPKDVWSELRDIRTSKKEHFIILYLDIKNQIIRRETISIGNLNMSIVHPREVFEPAITSLAGQIIISHNHPSGDVRPSFEDRAMTKRLVKAGEILGIELLDHVIVSTDSFFSFKEHHLF